MSSSSLEKSARRSEPKFVQLVNHNIFDSRVIVIKDGSYSILQGLTTKIKFVVRNGKIRITKKGEEVK